MRCATCKSCRRPAPSASAVGLLRRPAPSASAVGLLRRPPPSACSVGLAVAELHRFSPRLMDAVPPLHRSAQDGRSSPHVGGPASHRLEKAERVFWLCALRLAVPVAELPVHAPTHRSCAGTEATTSPLQARRPAMRRCKGQQDRQERTAQTRARCRAHRELVSLPPPWSVLTKVVTCAPRAMVLRST